MAPSEIVVARTGMHPGTLAKFAGARPAANMVRNLARLGSPHLCSHRNAANLLGQIDQSVRGPLRGLPQPWKRTPLHGVRDFRRGGAALVLGFPGPDCRESVNADQA